MLLLHLFLVGSAGAIPLNEPAPTPHEARDVSRINLHGAKTRRLDPDAILPIRIALTQSNIDKGHDYLMKVSDPLSHDFGKHWSVEKIHEHFAPSDETIELVKTWLESSGVARDDISESTSGGWLGIDIPVGVAERLFTTEYFESRGTDGAIDIGCDQYHVPSHLSDHIDFITPGVGVTTLRKRSMWTIPHLHALKDTLAKRNAQNFTNLPCGKLITPACIKELYNIPAANSSTQKSNGLGIFELFDNIYDQADLDLFFKHFANNVPQGTHPELVSINNATAPTTQANAGGESIVDFTLAFSLLYPQKITLYETGITKKQEAAFLQSIPAPFLNQQNIAGGIVVVENLLNAVDGSFCTTAAKQQGLDCSTTSLTPVLSVSYGSPEINFPVKFAQRACNEYMKLGLKGHTILFASGDWGPAGNVIPDNTTKAVSNACINTTQPQNVLVNGTVFNPTFPITCPYVLSVGATRLHGNETARGEESAMHISDEVDNTTDYVHLGSSGGFSNYFKQPSYQASAVENYLAKYKPRYKTYPFPGGQNVGANWGIYNTGGRAFPDVSANGAYLATFTNGLFAPSFGTSLSTPIWAAMITMVNDERAAMGKGPVGFINPTLYKNPQIFNDIISGHAPGCGTKGFAAEPGWDPITGLGTPKYPELLKVLLALP